MRWVIINNDYVLNTRDRRYKWRTTTQRPWLVKREDNKVSRSFKTHLKALQFALDSIAEEYAEEYHKDAQLREEGIRE